MDLGLSPSISPIVEIDGQGINLATLDDTIGRCTDMIRRGLGFTLFTLNLDHLVKRRADPVFHAAYQRATFVSADGAPLVWLARRRGVSLTRTTGADLLVPLCKAAAEQGIPVAFFGSSQDSLQCAADRLRAQFPKLDIRHLEAPAQGFDYASNAAAEAGARIAASGARLCFVALGAPKQEFFADRMIRLFPAIGYLGIGAAVDFVAGTQVRAPAFMQRTGLEWLWRLGSNPRRMFMRYAQCAITLASIVASRLSRQDCRRGPSRILHQWLIPCRLPTRSS